MSPLLPPHRPDSSGAGRRRRSRAAATILLVLALLLAACDDDPTAGPADADEVPDGGQLVEHPDATVVLPADWSPAATTDWAQIDPTAVELRPRGVPVEAEVAAVLWRDDVRVPAGMVALPVDQIARQLELLGLPGFQRLRDEPLEVAGTDEAHVVQVRFDADGPTGPEPYLGTYVSARVTADEVVILRLFGPPSHLPAEVVDLALASLRIRAAG